MPESVWPGEKVPILAPKAAHSRQTCGRSHCPAKLLCGRNSPKYARTKRRKQRSQLPDHWPALGPARFSHHRIVSGGAGSVLLAPLESIRLLKRTSRPAHLGWQTADDTTGTCPLDKDVCFRRLVVYSTGTSGRRAAVERSRPPTREVHPHVRTVAWRSCSGSHDVATVASTNAE